MYPSPPEPQCAWNCSRIWRHLRNKQRAQIAIVAPFAIVALVSVVGLVADFGVFRLIDSELENAADAAALAAASYDPVCPVADSRCAPDNQTGRALLVAKRFAQYNFGLATALCGSTPVSDNPGPFIHPIQAPNALAVTVAIHCRAGYIAGRILGLGSTDITRWATAGIGDEQDVSDADGTTRRNLTDYLALPGGSATLIARLVP